MTDSFLFFYLPPNPFSGGFCVDDPLELGPEYEMSMAGNSAANAAKSNLTTYF